MANGKFNLENFKGKLDAVMEQERKSTDELVKYALDGNLYLGVMKAGKENDALYFILTQDLIDNNPEIAKDGIELYQIGTDSVKGLLYGASYIGELMKSDLGTNNKFDRLEDLIFAYSFNGKSQEKYLPRDFKERVEKRHPSYEDIPEKRVTAVGPEDKPKTAETPTIKVEEPKVEVPLPASPETKPKLPTADEWFAARPQIVSYRGLAKKVV
ncbi:MAG: hypothetical protein ABIG84_01380 [archaeon]